MDVKSLLSIYDQQFWGMYGEHIKDKTPEYATQVGIIQRKYQEGVRKVETDLLSLIGKQTNRPEVRRYNELKSASDRSGGRIGPSEQAELKALQEMVEQTEDVRPEISQLIDELGIGGRLSEEKAMYQIRRKRFEQPGARATIQAPRMKTSTIQAAPRKSLITGY